MMRITCLTIRFVSRFALRLVSSAIVLATAFAPLPALAETITVGGVGSLLPLMKRLGEEYTKRNPGVEIVMVFPPLGSTGSLRALAAGKIDIALTGRELNPGETGQARVWVTTPLVLATFGGKTKGLGIAQIADIYAGRKTSWDDGKPIRLVLRGAHESETLALRAMSAEIDAAVGQALQRVALPVAENDIEAIEIMSKIPGSFGTTTLGLIKAQNSKLQPVAVNGQAPSLKSMESRGYPWRRIYFLVTRSNPTPTTAAFLTYLNSQPAIALARSLDYLPAK